MSAVCLLTVRGHVCRERLRATAPTYLAAIEEHYTRHLTEREIVTIARALGKVLKPEEP